MYLSYYKLNKKPFQISTDPSFFWLGEKHIEALSILKYAVMDDKGFLLLTGDVGTGKTTLINTFVNSLGDDVLVSRVSDPGLTQLDFISYIAKMFKIDTKFETKSEFLILFTEFLEQANKNNKKVLLVIDEAQHLTDETLEEIRLLSNIENQDKKLLNIFLVGQSEFNETLEKYKNRALRQRLSLNFILYPLEAEETKQCIEYRLKVAGAEKVFFTPEAIDAIHSISKGFPRVINIICDHALRLGCQEDKGVISETIIHQCSKTLHAAHLPQSHQYDSHFGVTNEWLEESEVPPLSQEAIDKVSQPLPDFILPSEEEITAKPRKYSLVAPLLIAVLLISGFFLLKNDNLSSFAKLLTSLYKNTIVSTSIDQATVNNSSDLSTPSSIIDNATPSDETKKEINTESTLTTQPPVSVIPPPMGTANTDSENQEPTQPKTLSAVVSVEEVVESPSTLENVNPLVDQKSEETLPGTSDAKVTEVPNMTDVLSEDVQEGNNIESEMMIAEPLIESVSGPQTIVDNEVDNKTLPTNTANTDVEDQEIIQPKEAPAEVVSAEVVAEAPSILEKASPIVAQEKEEILPETSDAKVTEVTNMTEVLSDDMQEGNNIESEVMIAEPPKEPVGEPQTIVHNQVDKTTHPAPAKEVEFIPQNLDSTSFQSRATPGLVEQEETSPPKKAVSDTNDDPGAVIDWLLKSKKN